MKKKFTKLGIITALAVILVWGTAAVAKNETPFTLKIGFIPAEDELPLFVGKERGDFAHAGVDLRLVPFASAVERDTAFRAGQLDGIVCDLVAVGLFGKGGMDVKVASITLGAKPEEGRFALLAAPGSGITSPSELKGVPVGVSNNSIIEFVNYQLLSAAGLKPEEIKTIEIPKVPVRLEMLINGQVKAATLPDPIAALAEAKGAKVIASDTEFEVNLSPIVYVFTDKALKEKSLALNMFYKTYTDIVQEINEDPEKFRSYLLENCRIPKLIEDEYPVPQFPLPTIPTKAEWDLVMDWMVEKGLLKAALPYEDYFTSKYVVQ
ncbi:MAG: ABC transporter substrate-binding protein [Firmicutes bacterium]|nr:ABC transporter substrate-binding protein [Bacillota bacterium]